MALPVQPYVFSQAGLDSGALTMLGSVAHLFSKPGEYRGAVLREGRNEAVFYLTVDAKNVAAQVNIDLAAIAEAPAPESGCGCGAAQTGGANRFAAGPKSYVIFHVAGGPGGYAVHMSLAGEGPQAKTFDSRQLGPGDLFAATLLRPGRYSVTNTAAGAKPVRGSIDVAYPTAGKTAYVPPPPVNVKCTSQAFEPAEVRVTATQGCLFTCEAPSRIVIELTKPADIPK